MEEEFFNACKEGNLESVKNIINNGIDPTIIDNKAILTAGVYNQLEVFKFLITKGANPSVRNNNIMYWAARHGNLEILKYATAGSSLENKNDTILQACSGFPIKKDFSGYLDCIKFLMSEGADIGAIINKALIQASICGKLDLVKFFIENGVDVQAQNNKAFILSSLYGNLESMKFLILHGAQITAQNNKALIYACTKNYFEHIENRLEIVKFLVEGGCNVQAQDNHPIIAASLYNYTNIICYLAKKGADWKRCKLEHQKIFIALNQSKQIYFKNIFLRFGRKLIPVYFSPNYIGGILAKKDLRNFVMNLTTV